MTTTSDRDSANLTTDATLLPAAPSAAGNRLGATLLVGAALIALVAVIALISLVWTPYDPTRAITADHLQSPSLHHLMGTDRLGRDVFSNIMAGAQITLLVGTVAVAIGLLVGTPLGILAAMRPNRIGPAIMGGSDIVMAFPGLLLAIVFGAIFGGGTTTAMIALGIASIPSFARVARAGALQVMGMDYVFAARAANRSDWAIARRHVLPNIAGMLTVQSSVMFAIAVLAEAGLSFLGLGTTPPTPSWGRMLLDAQQFLGTQSYLAIFPGVAIAIAVLGFNLLGDGLRDRFDPKLRGR